jgi:S-formylglutathione hydrolase FrmB
VTGALSIELLDTTQLTPRLRELRIRSAALERETRVRVLSPTTDVEPGLPVLFLLHGGGPDSDQTNWTDRGHAEALTEGLPLLVVMPDGGKGGWYSDWLRPLTKQGTQRWESYHLGELLPFVQDHFGTRTDRSGTAVAGLSMGGFGAIHYAARHPDRFGFAASFSGAVDIRHPGVGRVVKVSPEIMGGRRGDIFGDHKEDVLVWRAANPVDLAANLATVEVELRTGNGDRGGPFGDGVDGDTQEVGVSQATANLHRRLGELGIPHVYDDYGAGAHTWPYWDEALRQSLVRIVGAAADGPRPDPAYVEHVAFEPAFSVWGHDIRIERGSLSPVALTLDDAGCRLHGEVRAPARITTPDGQVVETEVVV